MRHGGPRGAHLQTPARHETLLLLEPCYIHIYRQHGGCPKPPLSPQQPECGRQGQGHQLEQEPCRTILGTPAGHPGQEFPGSSETTALCRVGGLCEFCLPLGPIFHLLDFTKENKTHHISPHPGKALGESEHRETPGKDSLRGSIRGGWADKHT